MSASLPTSSVAKRDPYGLVVVGASAGGMQALSFLLPRLTPAFAPAMIIALHQPPDATGLLAEIFAERCALPVYQADDKQPIEGGTVLFAPPGYHTLVEADGSIALSLDAPEHFSRPSIDVLFESAAWAMREAVLGILLSGASSDGAAGLARIQRAGGGAWVQDPDDAASELMPRSALGQGVPMQVLSLEHIARGLAGMIKTGCSHTMHTRNHEESR